MMLRSLATDDREPQCVRCTAWRRRINDFQKVSSITAVPNISPSTRLYAIQQQQPINSQNFRVLPELSEFWAKEPQPRLEICREAGSCGPRWQERRVMIVLETLWKVECWFAGRIYSYFGPAAWAFAICAGPDTWI